MDEALGMVDLFFCHDAIKSDIPFIRLNMIQFLELISQPYQVRLFYRIIENGKRFVIKARPHADSIARAIKGNKRYQNNIQILNGNFFSLSDIRLRYSKTIF